MHTPLMMARTSSLLAVAVVAVVASCGKGLAPIPVPVGQLDGPVVAAAAKDGRIYLLISVQAPVDASVSSSQVLWSYDPKSNSWESEPSFPTTRDAAAFAAGPDGKLYAIGGVLVPNARSPNSSGLPLLDAGTVFVSETDAYDPASRTWTRVAPFPVPGNNIVAVAGGDGKIYAVSTSYLSDAGLMEIFAAYDTSSDAWTALSPPPTPAFAGVAAGPNGRIYAIDVTVEAYDPSSATWSTVAPLDAPRSGIAAATGSDARIYAIGGSSAPACVDGETPAADKLCLAGLPPPVEAYDVASNSWQFVAPLLTNRSGFGVAAGADGRIYAFGGTSIPLPPDYVSRPLNLTEAYDPSTNSWSR